MNTPASTYGSREAHSRQLCSFSWKLYTNEPHGGLSLIGVAIQRPERPRP